MQLHLTARVNFAVQEKVSFETIKLYQHLDREDVVINLNIIFAIALQL